MRWHDGILAAMMLFCCCGAWALDVDDLQLVGLFKNTAVLNVQGNKQRLLKVGQTSPEGILLLATTKDSATLSVNGKEYQLSLTRAMSRGYRKQEKVREVIAVNSAGQYFTAGSINGQSVTFLVDTGATSVAMNTDQARRLGINFAAGKLGEAGTAGGIVKAYSVKLDRVKVGAIEVKNVRAAVLEGVYPPYVLLGMTYLRHVEMVERDGMMTLTK